VKHWRGEAEPDFDSLTVQRHRFSAWTFQGSRFSARPFQRMNISARLTLNHIHWNSQRVLILGYLIVYWKYRKCIFFFSISFKLGVIYIHTIPVIFLCIRIQPLDFQHVTGIPCLWFVHACDFKTPYKLCLYLLSRIPIPSRCQSYTLVILY
jgi:hypothetical protein